MTEIKIEKSQPQDLAAIVAIYNQTIACRHITSDLAPINVADRQLLFEFHLAS